MSDDRTIRRFRPNTWFRAAPRRWTPAIEQELAVIIDRHESDRAPVAALTTPLDRSSS